MAICDFAWPSEHRLSSWRALCPCRPVPAESPPDVLKETDIADTHVSKQPKTLPKERKGWEVTTLNFYHAFCPTHFPPGKFEDLLLPAAWPFTYLPITYWSSCSGEAAPGSGRVGGKGVSREKGSKVTKDLTCWCNIYWMTPSCLWEVRHH